MLLTPEQRLALKAIGSAPEIMNGKVSCEEQFPDLYTESGLSYLKQKRLYGLGALGSGRTDRLLNIYQLAWRAQKAALAEAITEFGRRGIDLLVYKGAEINERYARSVAYTLRGDVDLIVRPDQANEAKQVLLSMGFLQANYDTINRRLAAITDERIAQLEGGGYALVSFARLQDISLPDNAKLPEQESDLPIYVTEDGIQLVITLDLATGLDRSISADALFRESIASAHPFARTLRVETHLWYLCAMFYVQVNLYRDKHKLSQLSDLALLLGGGDALDWDEVVAKSRELDILPSLYYPLAYLSALCTTPRIPETVLSMLQPTAGSRARDYGWQIHKLLGHVEPLPYDMLPA
jgi:hypothetical protein